MAKKRVLVVEDSQSMRHIVTTVLETAGYQIDSVADGEAALNLAMSIKFDVVITDLNMPTMDGLTLIANLRALATYKHVPILALTANGADAAKTAGKKAGATGWIVKPFDDVKLLAALRKLTAH